MSKVITAINTASQTFANLFTAANTLIQVLANEIVTANTLGATTTGNGFVIGVFGANTIIAPLIVGGNTTVVNTAYLGSNLNANGQTIIAGGLSLNSTAFDWGNSTVYYYSNSTIVELISPATNAILNSTSLSLGNSSVNTVVNTSGLYIDGIDFAVTLPTINASTNGAGPFVIDYFNLTQYRACEYVLTVTDNNQNNYQMSKMLVIQNGGNVYSTEYAIVLSNNSLGNFTATTNSTSAILNFTSTYSSNTTVKGTKNLIVV